MKLNLLIILIGQVLCIERVYNINLYGINVANCKVEIKDTVIYNKEAIKLDYSVTSSNLMSYIFKVENNYTTIIEKDNHNLLYFKKDTSQPNLSNMIETVNINNNIFYKDSEYRINNNEYNIFSFLYVLSNDRNSLKHSNIMEREGKRYKYKIENINNNEFELFINEINVNQKGLIKYTDIFLWALFLPNTKKNITLDNHNQFLKSCRFSKGLLNFSANLVE